MFGLGLLFYQSVLFLNAIAILSEERFLKRLIGDEPQFGDSSNSMSGRLISLVHAVRTVMRPPLIAFNIVIICYELIFG